MHIQKDNWKEINMLQTDRLHLRNLRPGDAQTLYAYRNDSRCNRYQRYEDTGMDYLQSFVARYAGSRFPSREDEQHYAIYLGEEDTMIGDLSVFFTERDNCFTLGITIAPAFQGQGYGYALLRGVIAKLRQHFPAVDLVALIEKENTGSIALFQKLGFVEECYAESVGSYVYVIYGNGKNHPCMEVQYE